jgi:hypothetical protein
MNRTKADVLPALPVAWERESKNLGAKSGSQKAFCGARRSNHFLIWRRARQRLA